MKVAVTHVGLTVLVMAGRKPTAIRSVEVVLGLLRIQVAAAGAIGVVGLLVILRNLIALALVVIQVAAADPATRRLKLQFQCTRRVTKQVLVHLLCRIR